MALHLPEELLALIVQCLDPLSVPDLRALARISQASKPLHRLAEPLLYQNFPGQKHANPRLWLRGVLARPGRTQLVQHITIHEFVRWRIEEESSIPKDEAEEEDIPIDEPNAEDEDNDSYASDESVDREKLTPREIALSYQHDFGRLEDDSISILQELIDNARMTPQNRGKLDDAFQASAQRAGSTNVDLIMSLIVLACPDLMSIDIQICDSFDLALLPVALTARGGTIAHLKLHREGVLDDFQGGLEALGRLKVLERREVESLVVTNDRLYDIMDFGGQDPFGPWPSLESIHLIECTMPQPAFAILLEQSTNLTSLELKDTMGSERNHLDTYGAVLREYGRGIERLVIDTRMDPEDYAPGPVLGLGNLQELDNLRELKVTPWTVLGEGYYAGRFADYLPTTLQSLTMLDWDPMDEEALEEISLLRRTPAFAGLEIYVPGSEATS
jgi:hypothetical protein